MKKITINEKVFELDHNGFVSFGDVARKILGSQCQYASRYIEGSIPGYPNLGEGLRFQGSPGHYHSLIIHHQDVDEFVKRYNEFINR